MQVMRMWNVIAMVVLLGLASGSEAGVTIHYEGKAKNRAAIARVLDIARAEAHRLNWAVAEANVDSAQLTRIVNETEQPYKGRLTGVVIRPHALCEPLYIQFGRDLFLQDYVKTQFAGAEVHAAVVGLLRKIAPYFEHFDVMDEGEYWDTNDRVALKNHLAFTDKTIAAIVTRNPRARVRVKTPEGRFIDIIQ